MMEAMTGCESILAVYNVNLKTRGHIGVMRKVLAQTRGFSLNGVQVAMVCGDGSDIVKLSVMDGQFVSREVLVEHVTPGDFFIHVARWLDKDGQAMHFELAYVRYNPMCNDELLQLAARLVDKSIPMFVEMYTLEYQNELPTDAAILDEHYRQKLAPLVTGFFTPSAVCDYGLFLQRPLYKMGNGATWVAAPNPGPLSDINKAFNLIGVGYLALWHGYNRLYGAIKKFVTTYPDVELRIIFVGQGPCVDIMRQEARDAGVECCIEFTGPLDPEQLAEHYSRAHIGLGTLGFHRTGVVYAEPLKHREFMFYGLPFIYSVEDDFSKASLPGVWKLPADDSPVDLISIYKEYRELELDEVSKELKSYAENNYSWERKTDSILQTMRAACLLT